MDFKLIGSFIFCLVGSFAEAFNNGTYTIAAAKALRPNTDYQVSISSHGAAATTEVTVSIVNVKFDELVSIYVQKTTLHPDSSKLILFQIGDLRKGKYILSASGVGGLSFYNSTELDYAPAWANQIVVEVDKKGYLPGQTIYFHIIILDSEFKPSPEIGPATITITDYEENQVKRWNEVTIQNGVFSSKLLVSDLFVSGRWQITAVFQGQAVSKAFQVLEYHQPIFEVSINLPPYVTFNTLGTVATVTAQYPDKIPVRGNVTVSVKPLAEPSEYQEDSLSSAFTPDPIEKTPRHKRLGHGLVKHSLIDGKTNFVFNLFKDLRLIEDSEVEKINLKFVAIVVEEQTKREMRTETFLTMYRFNYKLSLIKRFTFFKPGLKNNCFVKLSYQDDSPVRDEEEKVTIRYGFSRKRYESDHLSQYRSSRNGVVNFDIFPPKDAYIMWIEATYRDVTESFPPIYYCKSASLSFIHAILKTKQPRVNEEVHIEINSTTPLDYYNIEVMARDNLVLSRREEAHGERNHSFSFLVTGEMAPLTRVVVYHVRKDGEVVADALNFFVEGILQNFVQVEVVPNTVRSGQVVDIIVKAKPDSQVRIFGVDQRAVGRYDILQQSEHHFIKEDPNPLTGVQMDGESYWWNLASTTTRVFQNSRCVMMTNGYGEYRMNPVSRITEPIDFKYESKDLAVDTWLFSSIRTGSDGTKHFKARVPDNPNSWSITAFSIDATNGLGAMKQPTKLMVFRPFSMQLHFPRSVISGEMVAIQVIVSNYLNVSINVDVTFESNEKFDNIQLKDEITGSDGINPLNRTVRLGALEMTRVSFLIRPLWIGTGDLYFTANSAGDSDAITGQLLVKTEGVPVYKNQPFMLDRHPEQKTVNTIFPPHAVPGSQSIEVSATPYVMGSSINNLRSLIQSLFDNAESNMLFIFHNMLAIDYLRMIRKSSTSLGDEIITNIETACRKQLTYRRKDGSFSRFGQKDSIGSIRLTAFVARFLKLADRHTKSLDAEVIAKAFNWIAKHQASDGSFREVSSVSHFVTPSASADDISLTFDVILAFLEKDGMKDNELPGRYRHLVAKTLEFLVGNLASIKESPRSLAIMTFILHRHTHPYIELKQTLFQSLRSKAITTNEGFLYWQSEKQALGVSSVDIETNAYCLLTYLERSLYTEAGSIAKWLVAQRKSNGGFVSAQDTIVGVLALAKTAFITKDVITNTNIEINYDAGTENMTLTRKSPLVPQKIQLPPTTGKVTISTSGSGIAIVQVSTIYHLNTVEQANRPFDLEFQVTNTSTQHCMELQICPKQWSNVREGNIGIIVINLPSGYIAKENIDSGLEMIKRVEIREAGTVLDVYFEQVTNQQISNCFNIVAYRVHGVADQRPASIITYDYFDNSKHAHYFYEPIKAGVCDICHSEDCLSQCYTVPDLVALTSSEGRLSISTPLSLLMGLTAALLLT